MNVKKRSDFVGNQIVFSFLFSCCSKNLSYQLVAAGAFFGGEGDELRGLVQGEGLADQGHVGRKLALFELVELVCHHEEGPFGGLKVFCHRHVVFRRLVPGVHDQDAEADPLRPGKIGLHELAPALLLGLGHLGVAVARQIDKIRLAVDAEKVDVRGFAGALAHPGEVFALQHPVDDRGFAHVGLAREHDLRQPVARDLVQIRDRR